MTSKRKTLPSGPLHFSHLLPVFIREIGALILIEMTVAVGSALLRPLLASPLSLWRRFREAFFPSG